MEWNRSDTIVLANHRCTQCHGIGVRLGRRGRMSPCNCVLRAIFRACYARFCHCANKEKHMSRSAMELIPGRERNISWGRKDEEYMADFILVCRRTLKEQEYRIFNYHFLLGADWRLCCRRLGIDRGNFFHAVYRIEQTMGRVFRELQPYGLFPLEEYFQGSTRQQRGALQPKETARLGASRLGATLAGSACLQPA